MYSDLKIILPPQIEDILKTLESHGFDAYVVGGTVRDFLLKKSTHDYDITTNALPKDIHKIFEKCIDTGIKHGTVTVIMNGVKAEITTFRSDGVYKNHRKPESVTFSKNICDDLSRRDFTMNAIAYKDGTFTDIYSGLKDIENKTIKTVNDASDRFFEDALRMMRAVRFSCTLNFSPDKNLLSAVEKQGRLIKYVSFERIKSEFDKIVMSDYPENISKFQSTHFFNNIFPNLQKALDLKKDFSVIKNAKTIYEKYALLFLICGEKDFSEFLKKYKFSNGEKKKISKIIEFFDVLTNESDVYSVKKVMSQAGEETVFGIINVKNALKTNTKNLCNTFEKAKNEPYLIKHLKVTGSDLINLGIKKEDIGKILKYLQEEVTKDKNANDKEKLIVLAVRRYENEN